MGPFESNLEFENRLEGKKIVAKKVQNGRKVRDYVKKGIAKKLEKIQESSTKLSFIPPENDVPNIQPQFDTQKSLQIGESINDATPVHLEDTFVMTEDERDQLVQDGSAEVY